LSIRKASLNMARTAQVIYQHGDDQNTFSVDDYLQTLLFTPSDNYWDDIHVSIIDYVSHDSMDGSHFLLLYVHNDIIFMAIVIGGNIRPNFYYINIIYMYILFIKFIKKLYTTWTTMWI